MSNNILRQLILLEGCYSWVTHGLQLRCQGQRINTRTTFHTVLPDADGLRCGERVDWQLMKTRWVSIKRAQSRHKGHQGLAKEVAPHLRGAWWGLDRAETPGVGFQLSRSSTCQGGYMNNRLLFLHIKLLIHLFLQSAEESKKPRGSIKQDWLTVSPKTFFFPPSITLLSAGWTLSSVRCFVCEPNSAVIFYFVFWAI